MVLMQAAKLMGNEVPSRADDSNILSPIHGILNRYEKNYTALFKFIRTLYLFTRADISTFAVPTTLFALFGALSGTPLSSSPPPGVFALLTRVPSIILLVWSNLLVFDIANQRLPDAIIEDAINKPSRPLPSGQISATQARHLLLICLPVVLALSFYLGPWQETLLLYSLTWMYNDLKGCDEDFIIRNLLIAIAYGLYNSAALRIAYGVNSSITNLGICWIVLVSCVIFTTEHICDLKDQAGDRARGRRSAPIVLGDDVARWTVAIPVIISSLACPFFFRLGYWGYALPVGLGFFLAGRTLLLRDFDSDRVTWKIWALWTVLLFSLPLVKDYAPVARGLECFFGELFIGSSCSSGSLNLVGVSSVAMLVESRRLRSFFLRGNDTMINIVANRKIDSM